eukprot:1841316-Prymnesium_polylepis.1
MHLCTQRSRAQDRMATATREPIEILEWIERNTRIAPRRPAWYGADRTARTHPPPGPSTAYFVHTRSRKHTPCRRPMMRLALVLAHVTGRHAQPAPAVGPLQHARRARLQHRFGGNGRHRVVELLYERAQHGARGRVVLRRLPRAAARHRCAAARRGAVADRTQHAPPHVGTGARGPAGAVAVHALDLLGGARACRVLEHVRLARRE